MTTSDSGRVAGTAGAGMNHELSMFEESAPSRAERVALRVAKVVASWWFPIGLAVAISAWVGWNVVFRPFDQHPTVMLAGLATGLATVAACHGPLILLTQRRAAERDRARDRETLAMAARTESDLHEVQRSLAALGQQLETIERRFGERPTQADGDPAKGLVEQ